MYDTTMMPTRKYFENKGLPYSLGGGRALSISLRISHQVLLWSLAVVTDSSIA
jgi:hypothetical protein